MGNKVSDVPPKDEDFATALQALREYFVGQVVQTLNELDGLTGRVEAEVPPELLKTLYDAMHKLAGAGGSFGFPAVTTKAREMEKMVQGWIDRRDFVGAIDWGVWRAGVQALREEIAGRPQLPLRHAKAMPAASSDGGRQIRLLLVHEDADFGDEMRRGLAQFGYVLEQCANLEQAHSVVRSWLPDIVLLLWRESLGAEEDLVLQVQRMQAVDGPVLPLVFLATRDDYEFKLAVARAGGDAFLQSPVDAPAVAGVLEALLDERNQPPLRVLIVDDDELLAQRYKVVLESAGMHAQWVAKYQEVMGALEKLRPDVLLMDLHMPGYAGNELARAIRYGSEWQSLPIVFLSAETNVALQHHAMTSGADDFLMKPISDVQLVTGVRARGQRARKLAQLMNQDSLTGLLKHASIKDRLEQELDRARRNQEPLALAMVDIDHFKGVNDKWGHPTGDQVIKTLSQMLRQRLRRMDSVGRYGGEEFLVVLPECTLENAFRRIDDIRSRFGAVVFNCKGQEFGVTISAGVVGIGSVRSSQAILAAADAALYEAKRKGRNRVCQASSEGDENEG